MLITPKIFLMASQGWPQKALHGSLSAGGAFDSTLTASNFQRSDRAFIYQPQMLQYNQYLREKNVEILVFQNKHHFDLRLSGSAFWTTSYHRIKHMFSRSFKAKPPCQDILKIELATNYYKIAVNIIINSWKPNFLFIFLNRFRISRWFSIIFVAFKLDTYASKYWRELTKIQCGLKSSSPKSPSQI